MLMTRLYSWKWSETVISLLMIVTRLTADGPTKAEDIVAVQIQHTDGNCVVHTLWRSQNDGDTEYEVLANETLMSNVTVTVNTVNGTRISALFPIRCAAYEISVSTSNVCGQATANYSLMQTPSHSLSELGLISYRTNPPNGKLRDNTVPDHHPVYTEYFVGM